MTPKAVRILFIALLATSARAAEVAPDRRPVYRETPQQDLAVHIYLPEGWDARDRRPAAVFFFGGGWKGGNPLHFSRQARALASRGMVAFCPDYRVEERHGTTPFESLKDAKSALRWVRAHAEDWGVDPERIAAGGGSAGGHLAAATATLEDWNDPSDPEVSCRPDALLLFNPVVDNSPEGYGYDRIGEAWPRFSPLHNIGPDIPPALFMLGDRDDTIPVSTARSFREKIEAAGGRCEVRIYEDAGHGFFNREPFTTRTTRAAVDFLESLGWIPVSP
ncbi:alpha/beta hydrolase [Kiritimatiella glycovorans]|uniref:Acetylxylan esterase n=1 Tax=Kiritimatiella glycovorans TaxID=1307763 RepID=A0A0G3EH23_9BACT|nr:alpha/beta hydrolase [Kiritimatiella glycovorans]AKJ63434.1 Acetylxylan esterase precursor [Kiritimatiella glycovorans]